MSYVPKTLIFPPNSPDSAPLVWTDPASARHAVRVVCDLMGLTVQMKDILCACVEVESGFNPLAVHYNKDKIASKGEMQSLTQLRTEGEGPGKKPLSSNELHDRYSYETREERLREGWSRYGIEVFPLDKYPTKEVIAAKNEFVAKLVSLFDAYFFETIEN